MIQTETPLAYRVPFAVLRDLPTLWLTNTGTERLRAIRVVPLGDAIISPAYIPKMDVHERTKITVHAENPELHLVIQVTWIRPDGSEFLWRISF